MRKHGKILKSETKETLLNFIGKKIVSFNLDQSILDIPKILKKFKPLIKGNKLQLTYDHDIRKKIKYYHRDWE